VLVWERIRYANNRGVSIAYTVGVDGPVDLLFIGGFVSHFEILAEHPLAQRFWERLGSSRGSSGSTSVAWACPTATRGRRPVERS
jgi:hypothetical protein